MNEKRERIAEYESELRRIMREIKAQSVYVEDYGMRLQESSRGGVEANVPMMEDDAQELECCVKRILNLIKEANLLQY